MGAVQGDKNLERKRLPSGQALKLKACEMLKAVALDCTGRLKRLGCMGRNALFLLICTPRRGALICYPTLEPTDPVEAHRPQVTRTARPPPPAPPSEDR